jgi:eukaryotic-like serine/threonine-protein kinase
MTFSRLVSHYGWDAFGVITLTQPETGHYLDHYRLDDLVARGGMASIFRVTDVRTGRRLAIKVPHPEAECDVSFFERFQREALICRELDHPGVLKAMGDESHSRPYMVMEWVEGQLLREVLDEEGPLPPERATRIALAICTALDYIHARGVVHRDLKPENVIMDADDHIKLIDFGIAAKAGARRLTFGKLSNIMGTADYISPEQVKGKRGDARSDVYALGIMLYEMLTGETPFRGSSPLAIMNARLKTAPLPLRSANPGLSPRLASILGRALERDPNRRYASALEFAYDLEHQDQVGTAEGAATGSSKANRGQRWKKLLFYGALAALPVTIFALLLYVARVA